MYRRICACVSTRWSPVRGRFKIPTTGGPAASPKQTRSNGAVRGGSGLDHPRATAGGEETRDQVARVHHQPDALEELVAPEQIVRRRHHDRVVPREDPGLAAHRLETEI